jgi:hypothetical protein
MKRFLILSIIATLFAGTAFAQVQTVKLSEIQPDHSFKTGQGDKRLDSIFTYWYNSDGETYKINRDDYVYNGDESLAYSIYSFWDDYLRRWMKKYKYQYGYGTSGNLVSYCKLDWVAGLNIWLVDYKIEYGYDEAGNLTDSTSTYWNEYLSQWERRSKRESCYDEAGNMTFNAWYSWDSGINDWDVSSIYEYEYEYDDAGNKIIERGYRGPNRRLSYEFIYDEKGNLIQEISYSRGGNKQRKSEHTYDEAGREVLCVEYCWDNPSWTYTGRIEYNYDEHGNLVIEMRHTKHDYDGEIWYTFNGTMHELEYDLLGNVIEDVSFSNDSIHQEWKPNIKYEFDFNSDGNQTLFAQYYWDSGWHCYYWGWIAGKWERCYDEYGNCVSYVQYWGDDYLNEWIVRSEKLYYYSFLTGIKDKPEDYILLFPNPTSNTINITGLTQPAEVILYSLQGQLIKSFYQIKSSINISDLSTGVYILNLISGNNTTVRKMVVKR